MLGLIPHRSQPGPTTFVVLAMLILIFGVLSWRKTPTDIFPNIDIPVITAVWTYNGLPPDDMSGRIVYYFERALSAQVNDIEHVESQSVSGFGIVKIFFQKSVRIETALPQVNAAADTVLKQLPAGATAPNVLMFNASSVPILNLALSGKGMSESQLLDIGNNFIRPQLATVPGAAVPTPYGGTVRQIQIDIDQHALQSYGLSAQDVADTLASQNLITPGGHSEDRQVRVRGGSQRRAPQDFRAQRSADQEGQRHTGLHPRRRVRT